MAPNKLREIIIARIKKGESKADIAKDFSVWNHVDKRANSVYHPSVDAMKAAVDKNSMDKDYVVAVCRRFRSRLEACVAVE